MLVGPKLKIEILTLTFDYRLRVVYMKMERLSRKYKSQICKTLSLHTDNRALECLLQNQIVWNALADDDIMEAMAEDSNLPHARTLHAKLPDYIQQDIWPAMLIRAIREDDVALAGFIIENTNLADPQSVIYTAIVHDDIATLRAMTAKGYQKWICHETSIRHCIESKSTTIFQFQCTLQADIVLDVKWLQLAIETGNIEIVHALCTHYTERQIWPLMVESLRPVAHDCLTAWIVDTADKGDYAAIARLIRMLMQGSVTQADIKSEWDFAAQWVIANIRNRVDILDAEGRVKVWPQDVRRAIQWDHLEIVTYMSQAKMLTFDEVSNLKLALKHKAKRVMRYLIKVLPRDVTDEVFVTAAFNHRFDKTKMLIACGADLHVRSPVVINRTMEAQDQSMLEFLLRHGSCTTTIDLGAIADVRIRQLVTLHKGHQSVQIQKLNPAAKPATDLQKKTYIACLASRGYKACVAEYRERYPDLNLDLDVFLAVIKLGDVSTFRQMMAAGVDFRARDDTAFIHAVKHNRREIQNVLLEHGADITAQDFFAASLATLYADYDLLTNLISRGLAANIQACIKALVQALKKDDTRSVEMLLPLVSDADLTYDMLMSPIRHHNRAIIETLMARLPAPQATKHAAWYACFLYPEMFQEVLAAATNNIWQQTQLQTFMDLAIFFNSETSYRYLRTMGVTYQGVQTASLENLIQNSQAQDLILKLISEGVFRGHDLHRILTYICCEDRADLLLAMHAAHLDLRPAVAMAAIYGSSQTIYEFVTRGYWTASMLDPHAIWLAVLEKFETLDLLIRYGLTAHKTQPEFMIFALQATEADITGSGISYDTSMYYMRLIQHGANLDVRLDAEYEGDDSLCENFQRARWLKQPNGLAHIAAKIAAEWILENEYQAPTNEMIPQEVCDLIGLYMTSE